MDKLTFYTRLRDDAVFFCQIVLGFIPYKYQIDLLTVARKRIVAVWGRQSGKTTIIAAKVTHFIYGHPNKTVLIVSKGLRQSMLMYSIITRKILDNPVLAGSVTRVTGTQIWFTNGSTIIALPCSSTGANLRGYTADMVIMDEAAFMPEVVITQVIFPMLATTGGIAIMLSTPWGRNHIFYRAYCDSRYWVQRVKSADCPKISEEFLTEQLHLIGKVRFQIEYEAMFLEDADALFTQDLIRGCCEKWNPDDELMTEEYIKQLTTQLKGNFVLGSDLGKRMDYSVIAIFRHTKIELLDKETGRPITQMVWKLCFLKEFQLKTRINKVMDYVRWLNEKLSITAGALDQTGIGDEPVDELATDIGIMEGVQMYSAQMKHKVAQYGYLMIERGLVVLPDTDKESEGGGDLITQMAEQTASYSNIKIKIETEEKGILVYTHPEGRHDDKLWAVLLALYATRNAK